MLAGQGISCGMRSSPYRYRSVVYAQSSESDYLPMSDLDPQGIVIVTAPGATTGARRNYRKLLTSLRKEIAQQPRLKKVK